MASKDKDARDTQKAYWEGALSRRLEVLHERGLDRETIAKDASVRKLRAQIRKIGTRLAVIDTRKKKTEEMARIKAEKMALPKEEKVRKNKNGEEPAEMSKRQQKLEKKLEKKKEKKQAPLQDEE
ncbi:MAG: hypothetical protein JXI32_01150 [Deltaproteobacteria bacterium]|nr:hypothetical protein [Deltaproteobacteria bacterium]